MLRYASTHTEEFEDGCGLENLGTVYFVSLAKFFGAFGSEYLNMLLICNSNNIGDIVKDFVAMAIIAEIDNILIAIISHDIESAIRNTEIKYDKNKSLFI